jgi:hypothetical protein
MRIQSPHDFSERGLDAHFACPEAIEALILLEGDRIPQRIWEPAGGNGAIVLPLQATGAPCSPPISTITACRVPDRGLPFRPDPAAWLGRWRYHEPTLQLSPGVRREGDQRDSIRCAAGRTNFLMDGEERGRWLDRNPLTRTWYLLPRLPMMHRHGWEGARSTSNTPHCWVVWKAGGTPTMPQRAYWRELLNRKAA